MPQSEKPPRNFRAPLKYPGYPYHGLLRQALDHLSNKIAIVDGERELTFGELESRSNACARGLTHLGIQKGDRVALLVPNSIEFEVAFFAGSKTGAILTSLNPAYKEEEVRYQLEDSGAKIVIVHESLLPTILSVRDKLPNLKNIIVTEGKAPPDCIGFDEWIAGEG
ncbi:MAG: AMP-binding protein, partial [Nitrospinaceae bacterium]|nr:AMP-binding protein [Nitrospinaceae bacterium]